MSLNVPMSLSGINDHNAVKKRKVNFQEWKHNKAKIRRNLGQPYVGSNGNFCPGRRPPSPYKVCWVGCVLEGCAIPEVAKLQIFRAFWKCGSYDTQRTFLAANIQRFRNGGRIRARYFIPYNGGKVECCKNSFMDILSITKKMIETVQTNVTRGDVFIEDGRGKHFNRPRRTQPDLKTIMLEHIKSYPVYETHYAKEIHGSTYLSPDLSQDQMFRDFIALHPQYPNVEHTKWLYRSVFVETKLKIGAPKQDTCRKCDVLDVQLKNAITERQRQELKIEVDQHHETGNNAYIAMNEDIQRSKIDPTYIVKCVDLQQVLFSPQLTHADMYYLRQVSSYNYCVYEGSTNSSKMYFWTETEANRGVDEISSIIRHSIVSTLQPLPAGQKRNLVIWSDRCKGQTNNWPMLCTLIHFLHLQYFTSVEQKFLVSGHSFLPCDRQFGLIENRRKGSHVLVPDEWCDVISSAQPLKPFEVIRVTQDLILDTKTAFEALKKPPSLKVSENLWFKISSDTPNYICTRDDHNPGVWMAHNLFSPNQVGVRYNRRTQFVLGDLDEIRLQRKYNALLPLSDEKKVDLRKMLPFLSTESRAYYLALIQDRDQGLD